MWRETAALVLPGSWRILMMLLPAVCWGIFARPGKTPRGTRWGLLALALVFYGLGFSLAPRDQMGDAYNFGTATERFGLNMSLMLEAVHSGETQEGGFVTAPPPETTQAAEETEKAEQAQTYPLQVMDFDFDELAERETNPWVADIHRYVASLEPSAQNAYTGLLAGKNLIFITAESFTTSVLDPDLTPTLWRLAMEGIRFEEYYQPIWAASTTGGEFSNLTGLVPTNGGSCMFEPKHQDMFLLMGKQLQKQGYSSAAYHNNDYKFYKRNETHTHLGYDSFMGWGNGMEEGVKGVWPQSDLEMVDFTLPRHLDRSPFSLYYMSVSGHCMYYLKGNAMGRKNLGAVEDWMEEKGLSYSEQAKCYLAANLELEYAAASMVRQLEEAGILEDTVIVIAPDHYPYRLKEAKSGTPLAELYGFEPKRNVDHDRNTLMIWSPCLEDMDIVVKEPVYSLDILPTLSNLFGLEFDSRLLVGRDVFGDTEPLVLWPDFSWKTTRGYYDGPTGEFIPAEGETPDEAYLQRIHTLVRNNLHYSGQVLDRDYFNYLSREMKNTG